MPAPTKPACRGSWPDPPPETRPTLFRARDEGVRRVQLELQRIAEHESFERFGDQVLGIVDDAATHGLSFPEGRGSGPEGRGVSSVTLGAPERVGPRQRAPGAGGTK